MEDSRRPLLRKWCLRVRSLVLFPRSEDAVKESCPLDDGSLSVAMQGLIEEAQKLGISCVADVQSIINCFCCMSWCIRATSILARKPTMSEFEHLVSRARTLKFSEEKSLRTIKAIFNRARTWQSKVLKALAPVPGETKAFNLDILKELEVTADELPLHLKEESLLRGAIEEKGARHCICGGPSDARFMLSCDKCDNWFHGLCVNFSQDELEEKQTWICPPCSGSKANLKMSSCVIVAHDELEGLSRKRRVAPEAPDASKMWPPFGLYSSESAKNALGDECYAIPDVSTGEIERAQVANAIKAKGAVKRSTKASEKKSLASTLGKEIPQSHVGVKQPTAKPAQPRIHLRLSALTATATKPLVLDPTQQQPVAPCQPHPLGSVGSAPSSSVDTELASPMDIERVGCTSSNNISCVKREEDQASTEACQAPEGIHTAESVAIDDVGSITGNGTAVKKEPAKQLEDDARMTSATKRDVGGQSASSGELANQAQDEVGFDTGPAPTGNAEVKSNGKYNRADTQATAEHAVPMVIDSEPAAEVHQATKGTDHNETLLPTNNSNVVAAPESTDAPVVVSSPAVARKDEGVIQPPTSHGQISIPEKDTSAPPAVASDAGVIQPPIRHGDMGAPERDSPAAASRAVAAKDGVMQPLIHQDHCYTGVPASETSASASSPAVAAQNMGVIEPPIDQDHCDIGAPERDSGAAVSSPAKTSKYAGAIQPSIDHDHCKVGVPEIAARDEDAIEHSADSGQSQLAQSSTQLNPSSVNLMLTALPVQDRGR